MTVDSSGDDLHHIASTSEIEEGERRIFDINGREVAVFNIDGTFHAILNYCTHQGGPLCEGMTHGIVDVDHQGDLVYNTDNYISCPWHGWTFCIETGNHLGATNKTLIKYQTIIQDSEIYVDFKTPR